MHSKRLETPLRMHLLHWRHSQYRKSYGQRRRSSLKMIAHGAMQRERYGVEETRRARAYGSRMCTVTGMQSHSGGGVMSVEREAKRACGLGEREEMEMGKRGLRRVPNVHAARACNTRARMSVRSVSGVNGRWMSRAGGPSSARNRGGA